LIIIEEGLGLSLSREKDQGSLKGIHISHNFDVVSHIEFVDDRIFLGSTTTMEVKELKFFMENSLIYLGAQINHGKRLIIFFNIHRAIQNSIINILGF